MTVLIIVLIAIFLIVICVASNESNSNSTSKPKQVELVVETLDIPDDYIRGTYDCKIAGITHYCNISNCCVFHGIVYHDSANAYNPNAMAIVTMNKRLVGYIPNNLLDEYWRWSNGKPFSCIGVIAPWKSQNSIYAEITAIKPCNESFVEKMTDELTLRYEALQGVNYNPNF